MELSHITNEVSKIELGDISPNNIGHDQSNLTERLPLSSSQVGIFIDSRGTDAIIFSEDRSSSSEDDMSCSSSSDSVSEECNLFCNVSNMY